MDEHNDGIQNPIVAMATKLRARRDLGAAIDSAAETIPLAATDDTESRFAALADVLATATKRLNAILGKGGVTFVRLEKPLRLRLRFGEKRVSLDLDRTRALVTIAGLGLDGDYQFDTAASVPALINLSRLSTEAGYGDALTGTSLLKQISQDAELPRPAHLSATGPISLAASPRARAPRSDATDKS